MNITLRQLRAFTAVAELGSFTEAAQRLHLTQAAMSVLVRELERELGVRLFDRHTRSVKMTDAGKEFLPYVLRMLGDLANGVSGVQSLRDKRKGFVRVAAPQLMACTLMPRVISRYQGLYPNIEVHLMDTLPEQTLERLASGDVELGIGPDTVTNSAISSQPLLRDRHLLICQPGHPLLRKKQIRWVDLRGHPFIAPTRDFMKRLHLEIAAMDNSLVISPVHEVSYMTTALGMVAEGLGVTACPSYSTPLVKGYGLEMRTIVDPEFFREVSIFYLSSKSLSPAAQSFVDFLSEFVAQIAMSR